MRYVRQMMNLVKSSHIDRSMRKSEIEKWQKVGWVMEWREELPRSVLAWDQLWPSYGIARRAFQIARIWPKIGRMKITYSDMWMKLSRNRMNGGEGATGRNRWNTSAFSYSAAILIDCTLAEFHMKTLVFWALWGIVSWMFRCRRGFSLG
jgi:hypothetical protein